MASRLLTKYNEEIVPKLQKECNLSSVMQVPRLEKIVLNMGLGEAVTDKKHIQPAVNDLTMISGQKPMLCVSKKAIAGFKLREDMVIGCKVTLRRSRMYEFLDRLVNIAMPMIRDFRGFSTKSFDGNGNFSIGIKEQIIFPEINYDTVDKIRGLDITFCTTTRSDDLALKLLSEFNIPFIQQGAKKNNG